MVCPRQGCGTVSWESGIKGNQQKQLLRNSFRDAFFWWTGKATFRGFLWLDAMIQQKATWSATLPGASKPQKAKSRRCLKKSLGILKDTFFNRNLIAIQLPGFLDLDSWFESPWWLDALTLSFGWNEQNECYFVNPGAERDHATRMEVPPGVANDMHMKSWCWGWAVSVASLGCLCFEPWICLSFGFKFGSVKILRIRDEISTPWLWQLPVRPVQLC